MNSLFFEEEIEFFTVKGTNHGKIAWSSDGKFEVITTMALNWQSWLDENDASKKYLTLCKELAKDGIISKNEIFFQKTNVLSKNLEISPRERPIMLKQKQSSSLSTETCSNEAFCLTVGHRARLEFLIKNVMARDCRYFKLVKTSLIFDWPKHSWAHSDWFINHAAWCL